MSDSQPHDPMTDTQKVPRTHPDDPMRQICDMRFASMSEAVSQFATNNKLWQEQMEGRLNSNHAELMGQVDHIGKSVKTVTRLAEAHDEEIRGSCGPDGKVGMREKLRTLTDKILGMADDIKQRKFPWMQVIAGVITGVLVMIIGSIALLIIVQSILSKGNVPG